ncbi:hypothetical protein JCM21900_002007 [Sporobolomyces salmonicolor]
MSGTDLVWASLLAWLKTFDGAIDPEKNVRLVHNAAGRGLVARGDLAPDSLLISIPNAALLNLSTLRPLYRSPFHALTATQLLSLHLALQFRRHLFSPSSTSSSTAAEPSTITPRDKFWPFLATLPRVFETVPLSWSIESRSTDKLRADFDVDAADISLLQREKDITPGTRRKRQKQARLLELLPPGVRRRADDVERRFKEDWTTVQKLWANKNAVEGETLGFLDFLLGWLNVNTRCIYFDLGGKNEDNLTLCPVIDMINHVPGRATKPSPRIMSLTFSSPPSSAGDPPLKNNDELAFSYGPHEDAMLLTEYGFVVGEANEYNAVEVDRFVEALFDAQGEEGGLKRGILADESYWGDMTLQSSPPSASWRVLIALRLLHLRLPSRFHTSAAALSADVLAPWYDVLTGASETVSSSNEAKVQATLRVVCRSVREEAEAGLGRCEELARELGTEPGLEEVRASLGMLRKIWQGEERIAKALAEAQEEP